MQSIDLRTNFSNIENQFHLWMQEAGIVKKLQFSLGLCAVIIVFLTNQVIANITELQSLKKELETRPAMVQGSLDTSPANLDEIPITETELKAFISEYLRAFFKSSDESIDFLRSHSKDTLFQNNLEPQVANRRQANISSDFEIVNSYLESLDENHAKAIFFGQENFPKDDYQSRNISIELIINTKELKVLSIPVFKVE